MPIAGERRGVQNPLIRYAKEAGWTYLSPDDAMRQRGGEDRMLLGEVFSRQAQTLNPKIVDVHRAEDLCRRLEHVLPRIEGNLEAWEFLRGLKTVFVPEEKRERNVRLMEPVKWQASTYHVTDEFSFTNGAHRIRLDAAFLINGIPVLLIETKSATKLEGIAEAFDQMRRYQREGPELLALIQLFNLTHLVQYYYGPTWNLSRKNLYNWKDEQTGADFETLVKSFLAPQRLVRMLWDFILFTRQDDVLNKIILRPHQMRAVERVVRRAADPVKKRGLVWHTQGSGKTFTMITVAKKLIQEPTFQNPTVLMLVDRNELETQLFGNLTAAGFEHVTVASSKKHLYDLLQNDQRGLIVSMIHKFDDIPANVNLRKNIIVLVDEAHRTTGGDLGNYLMGALPNATYIGFTGTPIDRTARGQGTFKTFGRDDPKGYLDKYSIVESISDGTTVPLHYTLAPNELRVDRETLEREFLNLKEAEGVSDIEELNRILDKAVTLRNMLKNPTRMSRIARYVADHYRSTVEPMGYKAFLVAVDREACARYKALLDQHLPPEYSSVVYSPSQNDQEELTHYYLSEDAEKQVRKDFRNPEKLPKILIVTEKLLTGFDAPVLYCMYLDKPMRDHVLLQAIARVNRPYEDEHGHPKPAGFVLDFVGIFEKLEEALAFDSQDVKGTLSDLDKLKQRFAKQMEQARQDVLVLIGSYDTPDKVMEQILEHFRDEEKRHAFYRFFKELETLYEIISPDPDLRKFIEDYNQVSRMYALLRSAYEGVLIDHELTRKTAELVQKYTESGSIQESLDIYEINENLLEKLSKENKPDTVKVFNLLKSLSDIVEQKLNQAPYLVSIGERAEAIAAAYQQRQMDTQEALHRLEELVNEVNQAEKERSEKSLTPLAFAVYYLLRKAEKAEPEQQAVQMAEIFSRYPHWRSSPSQERSVKQELYRILLTSNEEKGKKPNIEALKNLVDQIFNVSSRAGSSV
jgi:type I restriction enzyme R subunit